MTAVDITESCVGLPPTWTPPRLCTQLQEDADEYYRDINAAKYPAHPMEPAVKSVLDSALVTDHNEIDIFGCGSTFGNLMRFARQENKAFRMLVEPVGDTIFLIRRENSPQETIQDVRGYGHSMPEAYTTWQKDGKGSATHQRIIQYRLGNLKCLVRFEADGYLPDLSPDAPQTPAKELSTGNITSTDDDLTGMLGDSAIRPKLPKDAPLSAKAGGWVVPQSSLFDLKTRSRKRQGEDFLAEQLPRLWITQVPNFILGFHERGKFTDVQVKNVSNEVETWAEKNRASLKRFAAVLLKILDFARQMSQGRLELTYSGSGSLTAREVGGNVGWSLSPELKMEWARS